MRAIAFMVALSIVLVSTATLTGEDATEATRTDASRLTLAEGPASKGPKTEVPGLMNYQGTLTDEDGVAMDTTVSMAFSIYDDSTGGTLKWTETQPAVVVSSGIFNVLLGRVNSIPDTVFKAPTRWLGVRVGGDPELQPRQRITAVGYAFWASEADTAEYARSGISGDDGDWTVSGNNMYSAVPGSVGIGTTTPAAKLDVNGDINANSSYQIDGSTVLYASNIKGANTFVGINAGHSNILGSYNTFLGLNAGYSNLTGNDNTFLGLNAGFSNEGGSNNTFLGMYAGRRNTDGFSNTFLGNAAGHSNVYGWCNTFVGYAAGCSSHSNFNTCVGYAAGYDLSLGGSNTFLGSGAGHSNTGECNTFVGYGAGYSNAGSSNVFIGYDAGRSETGSNKLYIDNSDTTSPLVYGEFDNDILAINGDVGVNTTTPDYTLDVNGTVGINDYIYHNGDEDTYLYLGYNQIDLYGGGVKLITAEEDIHDAVIINDFSSDVDFRVESDVSSHALFVRGSDSWVGIKTGTPGYLLDVAGACHASSFPTSSDARLKTDVEQLKNVLDRLEKIRGVSFDWNDLYESFGRSTGHREIGVIAQEVEEQFPELVTTWGEEGYRAVDYGRLTGVLIEAVKELRAANRELRKEIEAIKAEIR